METLSVLTIFKSLKRMSGVSKFNTRDSLLLYSFFFIAVFSPRMIYRSTFNIISDRIQLKAQQYGGKSWYYRVDVTSENDVQSTISTAVANARYPLQGMIACHGISDERPALDYPMEMFRKVIDTNLNGSFICAQAAAKEMCKTTEAKGGSIVLVASMSAHNSNKVPLTPCFASKIYL